MSTSRWATEGIGRFVRRLCQVLLGGSIQGYDDDVLGVNRDRVDGLVKHRGQPSLAMGGQQCRLVASYLQISLIYFPLCISVHVPCLSMLVDLSWLSLQLGHSWQ
ncbi:hypothetical protein JAAARDRAFT_402694 [Jaapia argillacea MUCL 33604]|uniref:Uncharacterized protein n=1 Tax=Jaapia argillacea MUCL 33604 TaxID=933084 RepID=A0A067PH37_9AGAM|nr:hypothetical protein JAAARDRAFT_402694 [Jaapia argillacea MUCL 33604]